MYLPTSLQAVRGDAAQGEDRDHPPDQAAAGAGRGEALLLRQVGQVRDGEGGEGGAVGPHPAPHRLEHGKCLPTFLHGPYRYLLLSLLYLTPVFRIRILLTSFSCTIGGSRSSMMKFISFQTISATAVAKSNKVKK